MPAHNHTSDPASRLGMANPLADNPLRTRAEMQEAALSLWQPVRDRLSADGARAKLGHTGAHFANAAAELEGFARPLWGLVPLAAGGGDVDWEPIRRGLTSGTDPDHVEYWGLGGHNQRLVEMAAIGFALSLVPEHVWDPLTPTAQRNVTAWLGHINEAMAAENNWLFFQVLVNEGLRRVGADNYDAEPSAAALDRLEACYVGDGWYTDGPKPQLDYYIPWAMHFYGLIYATVAADHDPARAQRFRDRAGQFALDFAHWFADDGAALPFGRSLTYRFAQNSFWGALAFADVNALPWGEVKGMALRNMRWWADQPIFDHAGLLTIGYGYPNLNMAEQYNSPGSPYWAMKAFIPLAVPETHPFWAEDEAPTIGLKSPHPLPHAGMIVNREERTGNVTALVTGQTNEFAQHAEQKYSKFAYSTAFGFSVPTGASGLGLAGADNVLALSDDDRHWRVRHELAESRFDADVLWSRWQAWPDVDIETWLAFSGSWQVRVHRIHTERKLFAAEGGHALDRTGDDPAFPEGSKHADTGIAHASYPAGASGIRDLNVARIGVNIVAAPNTNLLHPRTVIPTMRSELEPGGHWLVCAVLASTDQELWAAAWDSPPTVADVSAVVPIRADVRAQRATN